MGASVEGRGWVLACLARLAAGVGVIAAGLLLLGVGGLGRLGEARMRGCHVALEGGLECSQERTVGTTGEAS